MSFEVQILGSNSAIYAHGRHPTSQILKVKKSTFLIDCGEGTQFQMYKFKVRPFKISCVFISHLHGDHYFGLIGLLTTFQLLRRTAKLTIIAPDKLKEIVLLQLSGSETRLTYPLEFIPIRGEGFAKIYENEDVEVFSFPLNHKIPCFGFLFKEVCMPRKINAEAIKELNLTPENYQCLRKGEDITDSQGTFHKNEELTVPGYSSRTYAFCTDTLYKPSIAEFIMHSDLLYHEATFMKDAEDRAVMTFHSTTVQAANTALKANVGRLLIGHFSSRYPDTQPLLEECRKVFKETDVATEGEVFSVGRKLDLQE